jgi:hypothetical protein
VRLRFAELILFQPTREEAALRSIIARPLPTEPRRISYAASLGREKIWIWELPTSTALLPISMLRHLAATQSSHVGRLWTVRDAVSPPKHWVNSHTGIISDLCDRQQWLINVRI